MGSSTETRPDASTGEEDGRHLRRERNRVAVVEAMLELYREGNFEPGSHEIAVRAGVSPRSVFRYFDDMDDLCRAAITAQHQRVDHLALIDVEPGAPLPLRIGALVASRVDMYDAAGAVGQVARMRAPVQPLIAAELTQARAFFRHQVRSMLAPELDAMDERQAANMLAAADVLCSFEAYQLLRHDQQLSRADALEALGVSLLALVSPPITRHEELTTR